MSRLPRCRARPRSLGRRATPRASASCSAKAFLSWPKTYKLVCRSEAKTTQKNGPVTAGSEAAAQPERNRAGLFGRGSVRGDLRELGWAAACQQVRRALGGNAIGNCGCQRDQRLRSVAWKGTIPTHRRSKGSNPFLSGLLLEENAMKALLSISRSGRCPCRNRTRFRRRRDDSEDPSRLRESRWHVGCCHEQVR